MLKYGTQASAFQACIKSIFPYLAFITSVPLSAETQCKITDNVRMLIVVSNLW